MCSQFPSSGLAFAKEGDLCSTLEGSHPGPMQAPELHLTVSLTGPAAPSYPCRRKTHKSAWPNPFSKQRKRPSLAHRSLFLFALDADHGPSWLESLLSGKGPLVFKVGVPALGTGPAPTEGRREGHVPQPHLCNTKKGPPSAPAVARPGHLHTQQKVVAMLPFPVTQPRHTPDTDTLLSRSSPVSAPHGLQNETSTLP